MTDLKTAIAAASACCLAEAAALETFKLPFDDAAIALLPPATYSFEHHHAK